MNTTIEELQQQLANEQDSYNKFELLVQLCRKHYPAKMEIAYEYSCQVLALAEALGDKRWIARGLHACQLYGVFRPDRTLNDDLAALHRVASLYEELGDTISRIRIHSSIAEILVQKGEYREARKLLLQGLAELPANYEPSNRANIKLGIKQELARIDRDTGALPLALKSMIEVLREVQDAGNIHSEAVCFNELGGLYMNMGEVEKALECYQQSVELDRKLGQPVLEALGMTNMGNAYMETKRFHEAEQHYHHALTIFRKQGMINNEMAVLVNMIDLSIIQEDRDKAAQYSTRTLELFDSLDKPTSIIAALTGIGCFYVYKGDDEAGIDYLNRGLAESRRIGLLSEQYKISRQLAEVYERTGRDREAMECYKEYAQIKDKILDQEKQKAIAEMQAKFDVETAEREKELFRVKNAELSAALDEVRRLNDNLTKVNNEKNEVLGIVAHDLKSPLSGVRMVASLVKDHYRKMPAEELEHQLDIIVDSTERMLSISSGLLKAQQIETGDVYGTSTWVNVPDVVSRIAEDYRAAAKAKQIGIDVQCEADVELVCSEEALRQAVENMVSNAVKFTPPGKRVYVRVKKSKKKILVEVQDEGPGIGKLEKRKLYGKYSRLSARPTGGESSTGLGLWIAKRAVEALHGRIRCTSALGEGTMFRIEVPGV